VPLSVPASLRDPVAGETQAVDPRRRSRSLRGRGSRRAGARALCARCPGASGRPSGGARGPAHREPRRRRRAGRRHRRRERRDLNRRWGRQGRYGNRHRRWRRRDRQRHGGQRDGGKRDRGQRREVGAGGSDEARGEPCAEQGEVEEPAPQGSHSGENGSEPVSDTAETPRER
jgi:hypothetical protein